MDEDQRHEQAAEAHNDPESTKPIEHQEAGPIQEQASYQNYNAEKSRWALTRYEFVSVLIQGGVFLVTSIYALLVFLQWGAMNATLNVAKETVDLSKRSLEITKRPWVVLTKVTIETPLAPERGMQVRAFLKNTGETPAMAFSGYIQSQRQLFGSIISCDETSEKSITTLGPHKETFYDTFFSAQPPPIANLIMQDTGNVAGVLALYICGKVTYTDIFSTSHSTEFCAFYSPKREMFLICPKGNTAD